jgi:hypothetical protein
MLTGGVEFAVEVPVFTVLGVPSFTLFTGLRYCTTAELLLI